MKSIKNIISVALLMGMFLTGSWASNCLAADSDPGVAPEKVTVMVAPSCNLMFSEVHQQHYLEYLVKDYDPAAMPEWQKAFSERQAASQKLEEVFKHSGNFSVSVKSEVVDEAKGAAKIEGKCFSITTCASGDLKENAQIQNEFDNAVAQNDQAAIKTVLPKVLDSYRQATRDMVKQAESMNK